MQQEVLRGKEIEFVAFPNKKLECPRCKRKLNTNCFIFNRVLKTDVCHQCSKSVGTNPFYNPDWKKKSNFVGVKNMSGEEIKIQITNLMRQGLTSNQARNRVFNDLRVIRHQKITKISIEPINQNLDIKKIDRTKNKELIKGLGGE